MTGIFLTCTAVYIIGIFAFIALEGGKSSTSRAWKSLAWPVYFIIGIFRSVGSVLVVVLEFILLLLD